MTSALQRSIGRRIGVVSDLISGRFGRDFGDFEDCEDLDTLRSICICCSAY